MKKRPTLLIVCFLYLLPLCLIAQASSISDEKSIVYVTPKGKAYHIQNCRTLARSKKILHMSEYDAIQARRKACKICKPQLSSPASTQKNNNTAQTRTSTLQSWEGLCVEISDGDTIKVLNKNKKKVRIRLYGIDTPEKQQAFGTRATQSTRALTLKKEVSIQRIDIDRYGREVALVILPDGSMLQEHLLEQGMAWVYPQYCKQDFCDDWNDIEEKAQAKKRGLWFDEDSTAPWEWRKSR